jgi:hypothetical protein
VKGIAKPLTSRRTMLKYADVAMKVHNYKVEGPSGRLVVLSNDDLPRTARGLLDVVDYMIVRGNVDASVLSNAFMLLMATVRHAKALPPEAVRERVRHLRKARRLTRHSGRSLDIVDSLVPPSASHLESLRELASSADSESFRKRQELAAAAVYTLNDSRHEQRARAFAAGDYETVLREVSRELFAEIAAETTRSLNDGPVSNSRGMSLMRLLWIDFALEQCVLAGVPVGPEVGIGLPRQPEFWSDPDFCYTIERIDCSLHRLEDLGVSRRRCEWQRLRASAFKRRRRRHWK